MSFARELLQPTHYTTKEGDHWRKCTSTTRVSRLTLLRMKQKNIACFVHSLYFGNPQSAAKAPRWDVINGWTQL